MKKVYGTSSRIGKVSIYISIYLCILNLHCIFIPCFSLWHSFIHSFSEIGTCTLFVTIWPDGWLVGEDEMNDAPTHNTNPSAAAASSDAMWLYVLYHNGPLACRVSGWSSDPSIRSPPQRTPPTRRSGSTSAMWWISMAKIPRSPPRVGWSPLCVRFCGPDCLFAGCLHPNSSKDSQKIWWKDEAQARKRASGFLLDAKTIQQFSTKEVKKRWRGEAWTVWAK